jgi:hypothetical protein
LSSHRCATRLEGIRNLLGKISKLRMGDARRKPMIDEPPLDPADHAEDFAIRWADKLEEYCPDRSRAG